ncbi:MAG: calcium-binding protein [Trichodesmium sp. MO_231.B1]|nr:calcium-binding protein [Trichodesmium sp. MO_231.B1]
MGTYNIAEKSQYIFPVGTFLLEVNGTTDTKWNQTFYVNGEEFAEGHYWNGGTKVKYERYKYYDYVDGTSGDDELYSHNGRSGSWIYGNGASDELILNWNGTFDDHFNGQGGNDKLVGRGGDDTLWGGSGNDALFGGDGDDELVGGLGDDLLYSGPLTDGESDTLTGGDDSDTFFLGDSTVQQSDVFTGEGVDWGNLALSLAGDVSDLAFTIIPGLGTIGKITKEFVPMIFDVAKALSNEGETVIAPAEGTTGSATITDFDPSEDVIFIPLPSDGDIYLDQNSNGNNLLKVMHDTTGTDVIATVQLSDDVNSLEGYSSGALQQDWFSILERTALIIDSDDAQDYKTNTKLNIADADLENLGTNKFLVLGAYGGFEVAGSNQSDYIYGTQHNDVLAGYEQESTAGTASNDVFYGFAGDDEFAGGGGADRIYGGDGSDTSNYSHSGGGIQVDLSTLTNGYVAAQDGYGTTDWLYSIENIVGSDVGNDDIGGDDNANILMGMGGDDTLEGFGGNDTIDGGNGSDSLSGGNGDDYLVGGINYDPVDQNDTLDGGDGNDTLYGGDRNDSLVGGNGHDYLYGQSDQDTLIGGNGDDYLSGSYGSDMLQAGMGTDTVHGGSHNDNIDGGMGDDLMTGGDGNDTLLGGKGYDTMSGNAGADTFILGGNYKTDTITDFNSTEGDKIEIDNSIYGFSSLNDLSFDSATGELTAPTAVETIAILQNPVGFAISSDNISLF